MDNPQHLSTKPEHYTPPEILERCRLTIKSDIDLDPASDHIANKNVGAKNFYSQADDPLNRTSWIAENVFCNPPGGRLKNKSLSALFWDKFILEYQKHHFEAGFFLGFSLELIPKRPGILQEHVLIFGNLFPDDPKSRPSFLTGSGRIKFLDQDFKSQASPTHGSFLVLVSRQTMHYWAFLENFNDCGRIIRVTRG